jgi:hypothetical protein
MIDEDSPHKLRCSAEEVGAIFPIDFRLIDQSYIDFVNQRRSLQRVILTLESHVMIGEPVQFLINSRHQFGQGSLVAIAAIKQ